MKLQEITFLKSKKEQDKYNTLQLVTHPKHLLGVSLILTTKRGDTFAVAVTKADETYLQCSDEVFNGKNRIYIDFLQKLEANWTIRVYILETQNDISEAFK